MSRPHDHCQSEILDGVDPLSSAVLHALKRIMHLNRQLLTHTMAESGGHPAQAACLRVIARHESITQRDLGEALQVSPAALSTMLQRIERQGLIERWPDETDQRLMRIKLTDEGRTLKAKFGEAHRDYIDVAITPLSEEDRAELARLLGLLGDNMEAAIGR